ncbi:MAG: squalene synthase HpnC [Ignavibacteriaceae bacterium]
MTTEQTYRNAIRFAENHYENFPVISFLIPKRLKKHIAIIYWFARTADDIADEGEVSVIAEERRRNQLSEFKESFTASLKGTYSSPQFAALHATIQECNLDSSHFLKLLSAFNQDITKKRYNDYDEVLDYCKRSANPVGQLMLELFNVREEKAFYYSDKICTALQLTNFLQDLTIDFKKGRIYLPLDALRKYSILESDFRDLNFTDKFRDLIKNNVEEIRKLFKEGSQLIPYLSGFFKLEIVWTIMGGEKILEKIEKNNYEVLAERPKLNKLDFILIFFRSIFYVRSKKHIKRK